MKKLFLLLAPLTLGLMVGCSSDDSAILDKIAEMEKEHDEMQAQIDAQQKLLDALVNKLTITDVTQTSNGYTITLSDGTSMTIKDGEPGDNFIESIVVGEEDVTFTLADGTVIVIPLGCSSSGSGDTPADDNKIYYTTSDNTKLFPKTDASLYGAILISNTYKDGQGVLVFDDAVTTIGSSAFRSCSSLTSVTIPNSVTTIGSWAFEYCSNLTSVYISDISAWCNISFSGLHSNPLSNGCNLYLNNELVTDLTIPDSVTMIGERAFEDCSSLERVTIGDSVTSIGNSAFSSCISLTSVTIGDSVTTIGDEAFYDCDSLTSITIPDGVTTIESSAFKSCDSLTSITIPDSVTSIGSSAFYSCISLTSVTIGDSVTTIGDSVFYGCSSLTSVTIPDSVTAIGSSAFSCCTSLTSVTIPDSVTSIGNSAFDCCYDLTSVTIPDSVTSIGDYAFSSCNSLENVYCKATTPPAGGYDMFYKNASGRIIYVPMESVNKYKSASYWSRYADAIVGYEF